MKLKSFLVAVTFLLGCLLQAAVVPACVFGDHAVLQRDKKLPVWGTAAPEEKVTVEFAGQKVEGQADAAGNWRVELEAMPASKESRTMLIKGASDRVELHDILVGEVWLCSGQSNMFMPIWGSNPVYRQKDGDKLAAQINEPYIRFVKTPLVFSNMPKRSVPVKWSALRPDNAAPTSAVAYFFGKELFDKLDVPIGLIQSSWGGRKIEPFITPDGIKHVKELAYLSREAEAHRTGSPEAKKLLAAYDKELKIWLNAYKAAGIAGEVPPAPPALPAVYRIDGKRPDSLTVLHNAMIAPYTPYAMRGAIWYQGESNRFDLEEYTMKLKALHYGWKKAFENPDFKLYIVQLAPFSYGGRNGKGNHPEDLPRDCVAQQRYADMEHDAGLVVINDVGNPKDIHPSDKTLVGKRLAALALHRDYGKNDIPCDSPFFRAAEIKGNKLELSFSSVKKWHTIDGKAPAHFMVGGYDGRMLPAKVEIKGAKLLISHPDIAVPRIATYLWRDTDEGNMANENNLMLGAFKADTRNLKAILENSLTSGTLVYEYQLRDRGVVRTKIVADHSKEVKDGSFSEITYVFRTTGRNGAEKWVVATLPAFSKSAKQIGLPFKVFKVQKKLPWGKIFSNVDVLNGDTDGIFLEITSGSYSTRNVADVPSASGDVYDHGDDLHSGIGYGCFQIHDLRRKRPIFCINNFRKHKIDLGMGKCRGAHPDWTFSNNGQDFEKASLLVLVR